MVQQYREDDGMDPGLGELAYDGAEYGLEDQYDEFGERIESDDLMEDSLEEDDAPITDSATSVEDADSDAPEGFGETLAPDAATDPLAEQADSSKDMPIDGAQDTKSDSAADEPMADPEKSDAP